MFIKILQEFSENYMVQRNLGEESSTKLLEKTGFWDILSELFLENFWQKKSKISENTLYNVRVAGCALHRRKSSVHWGHIVSVVEHPQCTSEISAKHCTHAIQGGKALGTSTEFGRIS